MKHRTAPNAGAFSKDLPFNIYDVRAAILLWLLSFCVHMYVCENEE